ncbi:MAG TPA: GIY-YIG nuclease family protein, partial [Bacteroidia bacterium]|nr:GIY-YIG nuclease family protein [Bacteroidia bacterium]
MNFVHKEFFKVKENQQFLSGIYVIRKATAIIYVGQTVDFLNRFKYHDNNLKNGCHYNPHLQNSYSLHGGENFYFEPIEILMDPTKEN